MNIKRFFPSRFTYRKVASQIRLRCALVEYNFYHGETMPTLVRILNGLGVAVDVFCPGRLRRNNPFFYAGDLHYRLRNSEALFSKRPIKDFSDFDFVIVNSLEPKHLLTRVMSVPNPIIGVMHNASLTITDQEYAEFFCSPKHRALVMAQHISDSISTRSSVQWIAPVELGNANRKARGGQVSFCVQGNVAYDRRNYTSLVEAVEHLNSRSVRNFKVMIIGRNDTADGSTLKTDIAARGLQHLFEFSQGELKYRDYYGSIASCNFLLPLVDRNSADHAAYFEDKLSTSMQIALAFNVIPIVHADLAKLYSVGNDSFTYSDDLAKAMLRALTADEEELRRMRQGLAQTRTELLDKSTSNIKSLLEELELLTR